MAGKDPAKSARLVAELWAPRLNEAATPRERVVVLVNYARAKLADDDPMWAELASKLGQYLNAGR